MKFKIGDEVRVKWEDHWEITGQGMTLKEIKEKCSHPYTGNARGVVVLSTRKLLVLASNGWDKHPTYDEKDEPVFDGSIFVILKKCIIDVKVFR